MHRASEENGHDHHATRYHANGATIFAGTNEIMKDIIGRDLGL
jgi:hypothetical protein